MKQRILITIITVFTSLFMMLGFAGIAVSAPTKIVDRSEYSPALNSIASVVMNWYGSLISIDKNTAELSSFDTEHIDTQWERYRFQYPRNISQIIITSTELLKLKESGDYQFKVKSKIAYKKNNKTHTKLLNETFVFKSFLPTHENKLVIKTIIRDRKEVADNFDTTGYKRSHYKVREFTYAWLAYIDGVNSLKTTMNANAWLDKASYSLKIGGKQSTGSIKSILDKKIQDLTKGGHLLHTLEIKNKSKKEKTNTFVIDLILEWKGTNKKGKPVIARIHQEIKVQINADKTWEVLSIHEEHLLPIIAPWMGLVC